MRISNDNSPISFLAQRLSYASQNAIDAINLVENVPSWIEAPLPPLVPMSEMLNYAPVEGTGALLDAIARRENQKSNAVRRNQVNVPSEKISTSNILVTNGATQAISLIVQSLRENRRTILCQAPVFIGVVRLMEAHGYKVVYLPDYCQLANVANSLLSEDVAAIYLNTPNNPTGRVISSLEMLEFLSLAAANNISLIIDAVYEDFLFDDVSLCLPRQPSSDLVYLVNSVSKNYGAPGLRVGWIVSSDANIEILGGHLERECVAISGNSQACATAMLSGSNQSLIDHVCHSRDVIFNALDSIASIEFTRTGAGTQVLAHLDIADVEDFADFSLGEYGLILATSSNYGGLESQSIRIPLGLQRDRILKGMEVLSLCIDAYGLGAKPAKRAL